ncbi:ATP synthase subunit I [Aquibacillus sp. 3ASR75-11]|uniref:ATP synthase subunit I n=1 Tax=Terrihalobacillus insolitus TaxID=2950438 RepID=A0A9X3WXC1_9BACI|nr:ATP synthase subunit I [Terrihalobacillus insolitus]MDC3411792.1 ATP synthase subunit I [Terrihalobacillus insolitus]MDC3425029.1 ATP synthase subunit I [Terrihalobacillus insolitus]
MQQYQNMITRQRKWMFFLLALLVLGAGFTPYPRIFLGLILGAVISFFNLWLLQSKVNKLGHAVAKQKSAHSIGTFTRLAAAVLAVLIALRFEDYFHLVSVIIGLMTAYLVIMIDFIYFRFRD